jgi:broad specificity phosphatase PhoE
VTRVYLVRHGRAAAGWDADRDPPLDDLGRSQADAVADRLAPLGPLAVVSSPLLRCRQTASPLATRWGVEARVDHAVAEIPSPEGVDMTERVTWLRAAMSGEWSALEPRYTNFRDGVVGAVIALPSDTVVFSHFVAINALIGHALGDDRLLIRSLDTCSVTVVEVVEGRLRLVEAGHEADTLIR